MKRLHAARPPGAREQAAAGGEHAPDLTKRHGAIGHELEHLLAQHDIERAVRERQGRRVAFVPIELRREVAGLGDHRRAGVEAADPRGAAEAFAQDARDDPRPTSEIEDAIRRADRASARNEIARVAVEDSGDEEPLEDVGEGGLAKGGFHDPKT